MAAVKPHTPNGPNRIKTNTISLHMANKPELHEIKMPKTPNAKSTQKKIMDKSIDAKATRPKTDVEIIFKYREMTMKIKLIRRTMLRLGNHFIKSLT
jgi:hypothetical protein